MSAATAPPQRPKVAVAGVRVRPREGDITNMRAHAHTRMQAQRQISKEIQAARRWEQQQLQQFQQDDTLRASLREATQTQRAVAQAANEQAVRRVEQLSEEVREVEAALVANKAEEEAARVEAVLQLKYSTERISNAIKGQNEKRSRKQEALEASLRASYDDMLGKGLNPYDVQRRQLVEEEYQAALQRQTLKVENNQNVLARRMLKEEKYERKRQQIQKRNREYERKYFDEQARSVIEGRNQEYLMRMTDDGTDMLDPTGRMTRIDPSAVVTIPDNAFGTGHSVRYSQGRLRDVTSKVRAKLRADEEDFGKYAHMLSTLQQQAATHEPAVVVDSGHSPPEQRGKQLTTQSVEPNSTSTTGAGAAALNDTAPKYPLPVLNKFEQYMHENARERQRARLEQGTPQVAAGRTFVGQAFIPKPPMIEFKDFEVGRTYKQRVQLTNTSYTFNSFKLQAICDEYADFFEVTYTRPGRMSAGVSCWFEIVFKPEVNEDIDTVLPCLAETGPFQIPIVCSKRRCVPILVTQQLALGEIVVGETADAEVVIENKGILPAKCSFRQATNQEVDSPSNHETVGPPTYRQFHALPACTSEDELVERVDEYCTLELREREARQTGVLSFEAAGVLSGYSTLRHRITCSPLHPGEYSTTILVEITPGSDDTFPGQDKRVDSCQLQIEISYTAVKLPIHVPEEALDFDCCSFGKMYRRKMHMANRSKVPRKIQLRVPSSALARCIELLPDMGFVQPDRPFEVLVKFTPDEQLLNEMACFSVQDTNQMLIPLQIGVPEQSLPVFFRLKAQLTVTNVLVVPKTVDFGSCYTDQQISRTIQLQNRGLLPIQYGFVHQSGDFGIESVHAIGVLLPAETRIIPVVYKPRSAVVCTQRVDLWTSTDDRLHIELSGQGVDAPVVFSHNLLELRTTTPGELALAEIVARNCTSRRQVIEFVVPRPDLSWLTVTPKVLVLDGRASARVELEFRPPLQPVAAVREHLESGSVIPVAEGDIELNETSSRMWSVHARWCISCFLKPSGFRAALPPLPLECRTVCVPDSVLLEIPQEFSSEADCVRFGPVPVGKRKLVTVRLKNVGSQAALPRVVVPFNALGPFSLVNAARELAPHHTFALKLAFEPSRHGTCSEALELVMHPYGQVLKLKVQGVGVNPSIVIEPENGILDFGHVLATDLKTVSFNVRNTCPFELQFNVRRMHDPAVTKSGVPVFVFRPERAVVRPEESVQVACTFQPNRPRLWPFREDVEIRVANQAQQLVIRTFGRCWERQLYVLPADAKYEAFARVPEGTEYLPPSRTDPAQRAPPSRIAPFKPPCMRIVLDDPFDPTAPGSSPAESSPSQQTEQQSKTVSRVITVGSVKTVSSHLSGSSGQFEVRLSDRAKSLGIFSVVPGKGTVAPGQEINVTVTMTAAAPRIIGGLDVGQWETFEASCVLKGGYVPAGFPAESSVPIELVAFIRPRHG